MSENDAPPGPSNEFIRQFWARKLLLDALPYDLSKIPRPTHTGLLDLYRELVERETTGGYEQKQELLNALLAFENNRTFSLGNGCVIPHLRDPAERTVAWRFLETPISLSDSAVKIAVFIVAGEDMITPVLACACDVLTRQALVKDIRSNRSDAALIETIRRCLTGSYESDHRTSLATEDWIVRSVTIVNRLGLHARATAKLADLARRYACHIRVSHAGQEVDARSIMGVMMLGAGKGTELHLRASGPDAGIGLTAAVSLIEKGFGETA